MKTLVRNVFAYDCLPSKFKHEKRLIPKSFLLLVLLKQSNWVSYAIVSFETP